MTDEYGFEQIYAERYAATALLVRRNVPDAEAYVERMAILAEADVAHRKKPVWEQAALFAYVLKTEVQRPALYERLKRAVLQGDPTKFERPDTDWFEEPIRKPAKFPDEAMHRDLNALDQWREKTTKGKRTDVPVTVRRFTADGLHKKPPDHPMVAAGLLPRSCVGICHGESGGSKSAWFLTMLIDLAEGKKVFGVLPANPPRKCLYVTNEDEADEVERRLHEMAWRRSGLGDAQPPKDAQERFEACLRAIETNIAVVDCTDSGTDLEAALNEDWSLVEVRREGFTQTASGPGGMSTSESRNALRPGPGVKKILAAVKEYGADIVVLDPLSHFNAEDENAAAAGAASMRLLHTVARILKCAIVVIHHVSKASGRSGQLDQYAGRGSTTFTANARMIAQTFKWDERSVEWRGRRWALPDDVTDDQIADGEIIGLVQHKLNYQAEWRAPLAMHRIGRALLPVEARAMTAAEMHAARQAARQPDEEDVERLAEWIEDTCSETPLGKEEIKSRHKDYGLTREKARVALSRLDAADRLQYRERVPGERTAPPVIGCRIQF